MDTTRATTAATQTQNADSAGVNQAATITTLSASPNSPRSRTRLITLNTQPSVTDTSAGNDTDINHIMARFERTGQLPPLQAEPHYIDCTEFSGDLTELINKAQTIRDTAERFISEWKPDEEPPAPPPTTTVET